MQMHEAEIGNRRLPSDRSQAIWMPVGDRVCHGLAAQFSSNDLGDESAALFGRGRQSWYWPTLPTIG
jgi:hypothetical protein